jgi:hypothetical protein
LWHPCHAKAGVDQGEYGQGRADELHKIRAIPAARNMPASSS